MKQCNIIFLQDSKVILSRKEYSDWKEVQNDFENYMASMDFETTENLIEYLSFDFEMSPELISNVEKIKTTVLEQIELNL